MLFESTLRSEFVKFSSRAPSAPRFTSFWPLTRAKQAFGSPCDWRGQQIHCFGVQFGGSLRSKFVTGAFRDSALLGGGRAQKQAFASPGDWRGQNSILRSRLRRGGAHKASIREPLRLARSSNSLFWASFGGTLRSKLVKFPSIMPSALAI